MFGMARRHLAAVCIAATVLIIDSSVFSAFLGKQCMWLSAVMLVVLPVWAIGHLLDSRFTERIVPECAAWTLLLF